MPGGFDIYIVVLRLLRRYALFVISVLAFDIAHDFVIAGYLHVSFDDATTFLPSRRSVCNGDVRGRTHSQRLAMSQHHQNDIQHELTVGKGYGTMRGVVKKETCAACREEILRRAERIPLDQWPGVRSKRVKDLLEWGGPSFASLLNETAGAVRPVMEHVLGPSPWLTSFHALVLYPEPDRSDDDVRRLRSGGLHVDFPYGEFKEKMDMRILGRREDTVQGRPMNHGERGWQFPQGFRPGEPGGPHTVQTIWILDLFTEERGGTALLPHSFKTKHVPNCGQGQDWDRFEASAVPQRGSSGDVLMYVGATWHTIGVNRDRKGGPRVAILGQWSSHYMCPLEAHAWTTPSWVRRRLNNDAASLLGFPGHVGGYGDVSRPPHRDSAPRFRSDSIRFAWDTVRNFSNPSISTTRSISIALSLVILLVSSFAAHKYLPILLWTALSVVVGVLLGFVSGTHSTLCRLNI